jgi:archaemetzincin
VIELGLAVLETPGEEIAEPVMTAIAQVLEDTFPVRALARPALRMPPEAFDPARLQYSAPVALASVLAGDNGPEKLLAVTAADLYIPMLSFVYGQAQLNGRAALVSLARLRQQFYGLHGNPALLVGRARKEAVHETGHLFGLLHCQTPDCAMRLSTNVRQLDLKGETLCAGCAALRRESLT